MNKRRVHWFLLIIVGALTVALAAYFLRVDPLQVHTSEVECGPMQVTVSTEGRTRVRDRFVVSAPVEGNLGRLGVKEGYPVQRGTILTWLRPTPLEVRTERQRQASLQAAQLEKQAADAQVAQARLDLEHATRELRRISALVEQGIFASQELDTARTMESTAREALKAATSAAGAADFYIEEVRSTLLDGVEHSIPLRSPVEGVVLRITQNSERIVAAGTPVAEIGDPRKLELVFEVLSSDAVRIRPGAMVSVRNWGGEEAFPATVRLIEAGAFTKVSALGVEEQRVNVIADFKGESPLAGDAYRVEGEIVVWETAEAIQVPVSALFRNGTEWHAFVVQGARAVLRPVKIGHRNQRTAEVLEGLGRYEVVILYPDDRLTHGATVVDIPRR